MADPASILVKIQRNQLHKYLVSLVNTMTHGRSAVARLHVDPALYTADSIEVRKDMTHKLDTDINVSTNTEINFDDCTDPVQSGAKVKKFNGASKRLRLWAATQLIAHHNRVIALGVHRRSRVDGPRTLDSKA